MVGLPVSLVYRRLQEEEKSPRCARTDWLEACPTVAAEYNTDEG